MYLYNFQHLVPEIEHSCHAVGSGMRLEYSIEIHFSIFQEQVQDPLLLVESTEVDKDKVNR